MIKQIAWNTFKNTGNIDTFLELQEVKNIEKQLHEKKEQDMQQINIGENIDGNNQNERDYFSRA
ncbi:MAG: YqzL family protein [Clostridia bacterium]